MKGIISEEGNMHELHEQHGNVSTIHFTIFDKWEQWFFLTSDIHFDSVFCNRQLLQRHFDEAKDRNARIYIFGDWFDAMQGRYDPRRSMPELRPEYQQKDEYYDLVVDDSAKWLEPYSKNLDSLTDGNHELSVLKAANTNIMERLVVKLNERTSSDIIHGGYGGWVRFLFHFEDEKINQPRRTIRLKYFHGSGGEAPVTRGAIQTNRQAVFLPDADIVVNGHSHNTYYIPICRERVSSGGIHYMDLQHHIRVPGYKQAYGDGSTGWEVTRGGVPKPIGGVWLHLRFANGMMKTTVIPEVDAPALVRVSSDDLYNGLVYDDDREGE